MLYYYDIYFVNRNQDRAMNNLEAIPGGFQALSSLYNTVQSPLMDSLRPEQDKSTSNINIIYIFN